MNFADSASHLLQHYGYLAVLILPLLESAGIPVPGETMLLTAAVYAATTGRLSILGVIGAAATGAILGDNVGYVVGRSGGRALILRFGRYVHVGERQLDLGERFFARHGDKTVFLARFIAIMRTIGAVLAGASRMRYQSFLVFNAAGGICWAAGYGLLAYALGRQFSRYHTAIAGAGLFLGVVVVVVVGGLLVFGRKRLERWAVGPSAPG